MPRRRGAAGAGSAAICRIGCGTGVYILGAGALVRAPSAARTATAGVLLHDRRGTGTSARAGLPPRARTDHGGPGGWTRQGRSAVRSVVSIGPNPPSGHSREADGADDRRDRQRAAGAVVRARAGVDGDAAVVADEEDPPRGHRDGERRTALDGRAVGRPHPRCAGAAVEGDPVDGDPGAGVAADDALPGGRDDALWTSVVPPSGVQSGASTTTTSPTSAVRSFESTRNRSPGAMTGTIEGVSTATSR